MIASMIVNIAAKNVEHHTRKHFSERLFRRVKAVAHYRREILVTGIERHHFTEFKQRQCRADIDTGLVQLPSFHRAWQWDLDRIIDLLDFISERYPISSVVAVEANIPMPWGRRLLDGVPPDASMKDHASLISSTDNSD